MNKTMSRAMLAGIAVLISGVSYVSAAPPTFYKDIVPIFQRECQSCHRPAGMNVSGMIAPMSLVTYEEVRPWNKAVLASVSSRLMPPWSASPVHHGVFENERYISDDEVKTIGDWVRAGSPRGNPNDAPAPIKWPESGWTINGGEPDLIVTFDEPYWVGDDIDDQYKNITVQLTEEQVPEPMWLKSIEFKPGSEVVHHIIAYAVGQGEGGGMAAGMLGGEAPGTQPTTLPDGYGILVPKAPRVTFQMHYHKEVGPGTGVFDQSSFALEFHDEPVTHPVTTTAVSHGAFEIPPTNANWKVGGAQTFRRDTTIMGFMPHLHLRGKACRYTAVYPDGSREVLLDVPAYDFNWQIFYEYGKNGLKDVPAGTRVEFEMWFDNSPARAAAVGYNAHRPVAFGGPTWDEMDLGWMSYTNTEPVGGDD